MSSGGSIGAGDLAQAVIFLSYSHRFLTHHNAAGHEGMTPYP